MESLIVLIITIKKILLKDGNVVGAVLYGDIDDGSRFYNMMKKGESTEDHTCIIAY